MPAAHRLLLIAVLALPWLWPFTSGPTAGTQPYLASMALAALLLALWPARQDPRQAVHWVATGWLLAAAVSAVIALLQYFDLEGPLYPGSISRNPARRLATCASPISWPRCW